MKRNYKFETLLNSPITKPPFEISGTFSFDDHFIEPDDEPLIAAYSYIKVGESFTLTVTRLPNYK